MARKNLTEAENAKSTVTNAVDLMSAIERYGDSKARESALKKEIAEDNEFIKTHLKEMLKDGDEQISLSSSNYAATFKLRDDSKMNEEKLISYLKKHKLAKGIVKKKEYIDETAFENAVFEGVITGEQLNEMDNCKDVKITEVLTIKKKKKEG